LKRALSLILGVIVAGIGVAFASDDWAEYKDEHYGFEMKMPHDTKYVEKEAKDGWAYLHAEKDHVEFLALTKQGTEAKAEDIEKFGVKFTGIAASHWKEIDKGKDHNGWKWWKSVEVSDGKNLLYGGYGVGPKGSYMLLLKTTEADYAAHKANYKAWYESIKLH
jgi:hypothetical protein